MTNEKIKSKVKLHKVDENNDALEGVTIGLYDLNDNLLETYVTDSNGDIEIELEYGSYYFQEISTLDGYILSDEKVFFDVNKNGDFIQKTLINEFEEIEVPNTYKNAYDLSSIISLLITILGISLIIYAKKSEK